MQSVNKKYVIMDASENSDTEKRVFMKETVLYYAPANAPAAFRRKEIMTAFGASVRTVTPGQIHLSVGTLLGLSGFPSKPAPSALMAPDEEVLLMHGFTDPRIDSMLLAMRMAGLPPVSLKAVLTPFNCAWTFSELAGELKAEHAQMHPAGR